MTAPITLRAEHAELTRLQAFAEEFAHECDLPDDERFRLLVILDELFTNAVTHVMGRTRPVEASPWRSGGGQAASG